MEATDFTNQAPGRLVRNLQGQDAFLPNPLPPQLEWTQPMVQAVSQATHQLGLLSGLGRRMPHPMRLVRMFLRREAEYSGRIEQTHASVRTVLFAEMADDLSERSAAVREVSNNFTALVHGVETVSVQPITVSLLRALNKQLFEGLPSREHVRPGEFRKIQNLISTSNDIAAARFVPPPWQEVEGLMRDLADYASSPDDLPSVVRAAIAHYQFECIHPFGDGNGRIGRVLIMLMLVKDGALATPLCNASAALERRRSTYYDRLLAVSLRGEWQAWIQFFAECIAEESRRSISVLDRLDQLRTAYHDQVRQVGRSALLAALVDELFAEPSLTVAKTADLLDVSFNTAQRLVDQLVNLGIITEVTGRLRNRIYFCDDIINCFSDAE